MEIIVSCISQPLLKAVPITQDTIIHTFFSFFSLQLEHHLYSPGAVWAARYLVSWSLWRQQFPFGCLPGHEASSAAYGSLHWSDAAACKWWMLYSVEPWQSKTIHHTLIPQYCRPPFTGFQKQWTKSWAANSIWKSYAQEKFWVSCSIKIDQDRELTIS